MHFLMHDIQTYQAFCEKNFSHPSPPLNQQLCSSHMQFWLATYEQAYLLVANFL